MALEHIDFSVKSDPKREAENRKIAENLLKNATVRSLMEYNHISEDSIRSHPWSVKRWLQSYQPCIGCKGLAFCKQKPQGIYDNLIDDGFLHTVKASCKYKRVQDQKLAHMENYIINDLPDDLETVSFDQISMEHENEEYLEVMKEAMQACYEKKGLYLCGNMGTGKTYLSACACNYQAKKGKQVAFIHYPSFVQRMASQVSNGEFRSEFKRACFADFAVIDDIGAESVTEWNRDQILLPLLNERYEKKLPTWFTSNEDLKSLEDHFRFSSRGKEETIKAARITERISVMAKVATLTGKDRRKTR